MQVGAGGSGGSANNGLVHVMTKRANKQNPVVDIADERMRRERTWNAPEEKGIRERHKGSGLISEGLSD